MKRTLVYTLDDDDPNWKTLLEEAFNRVTEFAPEIRVAPPKPKKGEDRVRTPYARFNRITHGEFDASDLLWLRTYSISVFYKAYSGVSKYVYPELGESVMQAARNVRVTVEDFLNYVDPQS